MLVLRIALVFLLAAIVMGLVGFLGAGTHAHVARVLFFIFSFIFVAGLIATGLLRKGVL